MTLVECTADCEVQRDDGKREHLRSSSNRCPLSLRARLLEVSLAGCSLRWSRVPPCCEVEVDFVRRSRLPLHHLLFEVGGGEQVEVRRVLLI